MEPGCASERKLYTTASLAVSEESRYQERETDCVEDTKLIMRVIDAEDEHKGGATYARGYKWRCRIPSMRAISLGDVNEGGKTLRMIRVLLLQRKDKEETKTFTGSSW